MNTKRTITVISEGQELKVRTRCQDFGSPSDCSSCRKCINAKNQISVACHIKAEQVKQNEQTAEQKRIANLEAKVAELEAINQEQQEEIAKLRKENTVKTCVPIKRRKGTKLDLVKRLVQEGRCTKQQLAEKIGCTIGTLAVYLTKLRKEFGMQVVTPKDQVVYVA